VYKGEQMNKPENPYKEGQLLVDNDNKLLYPIIATIGAAVGILNGGSVFWLYWKRVQKNYTIMEDK